MGLIVDLFVENRANFNMAYDVGAVAEYVRGIPLMEPHATKVGTFTNEGLGERGGEDHGFGCRAEGREMFCG